MNECLCVDNVVNEKVHNILDFIIDNLFHVLNGRFGPDSNKCIYNNKNSAVVDYMITFRQTDVVLSLK